jgi:2-polyprenyl-3-methyl-5-hydroxy-6-metoxy-1,4-benzoquinol methylase
VSAHEPQPLSGDFASVPRDFLAADVPDMARILEGVRGTQAGPYFRFAHSLLPAAPPAGARLVDIGGGSGGWAVYAREKGWAVTVVDASPARLGCAGALGFATLRHDLNLPLPFPDGHFGAAVMSEVLEHIPMAEQLLAETARILIPRGALVLTTPNHAHYKRRVRALQGRSPDDEGVHFRFFVRKKLVRMAEAAGFRIRDRHSYGTIPLLDRLLLRRRRGLGRKLVVVPRRLEALLADRFVWLLERREAL